MLFTYLLHSATEYCFAREIPGREIPGNSRDKACPESRDRMAGSRDFLKQICFKKVRSLGAFSGRSLGVPCVISGAVFEMVS